MFLHVEGDAAIRKAIDAIDYADETGEPLDPSIRHVFTHIDHASTSLVGRMKQRGLMAQLQYHWADPGDEYYVTATSRNVPEYIMESSFNNHGMVANSGIDYGTGADAPMSPIYKPFDQIEIALTRQGVGQADGDRMPGTALTLQQALHGFTLGGARLMHKEALIGSLEKGKKADNIVLDRDLHQQAETDVYKLHETTVKRTYLDGNLVWSIEDKSN